jgi:Zn-dependent peptidase ImmA (M78 family)/DNA-binding XRE family transcriptional regulator
MADRAFVTPAVLKWARETAKMTVEQAAAKAGVTSQKIVDWEGGLNAPTVRQARLLAEAYRRPFALFMLPKAPIDWTPLNDFRRKNAIPLTTASEFLIRDVRERQAWTHDWNADQGEEPLSFVGRYSIRNRPSDVATDILRELDIHPPNYSMNPMKEWLVKAESRGIFISRTSYLNSHLTLNSDEFQGFAIADPMAPFIFINAEDWEAAQLFTLVHELVHIWIGETGISNEIKPESGQEKDIDEVERFCNEVAAVALMPAELMENLPKGTFQSSDQVFQQAQRCGVSAFALLARARNFELISLSSYNRLKKAADQAFRVYEEKELARKTVRDREGGPDFHRMQAMRNGQLFSRMVLDAYHGGLVEPAEASGLLGTKINDFPKLAQFVYP